MNRAGDVARFGRASDRHAAEAVSIPRCGEGFFSLSQLSVQTLLRVQSHALTSVRALKILWSMSEFGGLNGSSKNTQCAP